MNVIALPCCHAISFARSEEHTSELQSRENLVCRLLLEKKKHNSHWQAILITNVDRTAKCRASPELALTLIDVMPSSYDDPDVSAPAIALVFFFNDTATTEIYTLSLHDALPIPVEFGAVFPSGAYAAGSFEPVRNFDSSTGEKFGQSHDKASGLPLWVIEGI